MPSLGIVLLPVNVMLCNIRLPVVLAFVNGDAFELYVSIAPVWSIVSFAGKTLIRQATSLVENVKIYSKILTLEGYTI